jgi:CheY-like chemotaxis protein
MLIQSPCSGHEATLDIRAAGINKEQLSIVAVTANALEEEREKCREEGFNDFLVKPLKKEVLRAKCEEANCSRFAR